MKVDFFDFQDVPKSIKEEWKKALERVISSGVFIGGEEVKHFEDEFAQMYGSRFAVGVSNGFDGLELALRAMNIESGSLVAVPAHTFIATWNAVLAVGAIPVGIDVDDNGGLDVEEFRKKCEEFMFSCVIPVHMHGHPVNMKELMRICQERDIKIIEDASQAHFAEEDNALCGTFGSVGVFSLYPTKNLGALGDAGVIVCDSEEIYAKLLLLRNYGAQATNKYSHEVFGFNRRLDPMQAAILRCNLKNIVYWNNLRREVAEKYKSVFSPNSIRHIEGKPGSVWHHFCVLSEKRDELRNYLRTNGVECDIHYPNLAAYEVADFLGKKRESFPTAEKLVAQTLSLPITQFHSLEKIDHVIKVMLVAKTRGLI